MAKLIDPQLSRLIEPLNGSWMHVVTWKSCRKSRALFFTDHLLGICSLFPLSLACISSLHCFRFCIFFIPYTLVDAVDDRNFLLSSSDNTSSNTVSGLRANDDHLASYSQDYMWI
jgi:hypothetical protein